MPLRKSLTSTFKASCSRNLREEVRPLTEQHERFITVRDVAHIEAFVAAWLGLPGRPPGDRHALARAFVAKAVLGLPQTKQLIDRLIADKTMAQGYVKMVAPGSTGTPACRRVPGRGRTSAPAM